MNREEKQLALEELNRREEERVKNGPLAQSATQAVPGEGNPDADILFIGEGPGKKEDELGRPFVGAAGKFLNELIESIGLQREDVFIANIVKHRPPGNRDPLPDEVELYKPWLEEQINIIEPKLIITLGRHSMGWLLGPNLSITAIHGQPKRRNGKVVMPMYHPAAALYRGDLRPVLKADFAKIPKVIELIDKDQGVTAAEQEEEIEKQAALL
ncbi:MAG: uracil-DNA glycosylase [Candidatus Andersenbacteria bacterium]